MSRAGASLAIPLVFVPLALSQWASVGLPRVEPFNGTYTIVNKVNHGRIVASETHGFTVVSGGPINENHMWRFVALDNRSHAIMNFEHGMRILAKTGEDMKAGFFVMKDGPIYSDQKWWLTPQLDGSYTIVNAKSGRRIMAHTGQDAMGGFAAIAEEAPLHDDHTWWLINQDKDETGRLMLELEAQSALTAKLAEEIEVKACVASPVASELQPEIGTRRTGQPDAATAHAEPHSLVLEWVCQDSTRFIGFLVAAFAVVAVAVTTFSLALSRSRRDLQLESARSEQLAAQAVVDVGSKAAMIAELEEKRARVAHLEREFEAELRDGPATSAHGSGVIAVGAVPVDFGFHVRDTEVDRETMRLIKVRCLGVKHSDVEVELIFNGCDVTIQRRASCGVEAATWKKRFQFKPSDGLFEFKEDQMQLEHGFLQLVFRAYRFQSRVILFPQHFPLAATDSDNWWDYPEDAEDAVQPPGPAWQRKGRPLALKCTSHVADTESTMSTTPRRGKRPASFSIASPTGSGGLGVSGGLDAF